MRNQWGTIDVPARTSTVEVATNVASRILPWPMTVMDVQAELVGPATSGTITLDVKANGTSFLLVKLFIEAGEITSQTATVQPAFVAPTASSIMARQILLAKGTQITVDILGEGSGDASWLRVVLLGIQHIDGATVSPPLPELVQVTINQASGQSDPTSTSPIEFDVVFSENVTGFTDADVTLSGTAGADTAVVTGSDDTYLVEVSGMSTDGTVIATIPGGVATSAATGIANAPSTSTDNVVTWATPSEVIEASDNFNRSNSTSLGANWTESGGARFGIDTNRLQIIAGGSASWAMWNTPMSTDDQFVRDQFVAMPSNTGIWAWLRGDDETTVTEGYQCGWNASTSAWNIHRFSGSFTLLASVSASGPLPGHIVEAGVKGSVITIKQNGVAVLSYDDSAFGAGFAGNRYIGFRGNATGATAEIDNFEAGILL